MIKSKIDNDVNLLARGWVKLVTVDKYPGDLFLTTVTFHRQSPEGVRMLDNLVSNQEKYFEEVGIDFNGFRLLFDKGQQDFRFIKGNRDEQAG